MGKRSTADNTEILYKEAEDLLERDIDAAFDVLFEEVLKRRKLKLSTRALSIPTTVVYN